MDIQEKKAFEIAFDNKLGARGCQFDLDEDGNYEDRETLCGWHMWQAAKAQSDKKIKLLLCDEHLQKCESPTGVFNSQYPDEEPCLICLAKEAKAQAVPEGFVLVPKEIPDSVIERLRYSSYHWGDGTRDYFTPIYQMMIEAQEPAND